MRILATHDRHITHSDVVKPPDPGRHRPSPSVLHESISTLCLAATALVTPGEPDSLVVRPRRWFISRTLQAGTVVSDPVDVVPRSASSECESARCLVLGEQATYRRGRSLGPKERCLPSFLPPRLQKYFDHLRNNPPFPFGRTTCASGRGFVWLAPGPPAYLSGSIGEDAQGQWHSVRTWAGAAVWNITGVSAGRAEVRER